MDFGDIHVGDEGLEPGNAPVGNPLRQQQSSG